MASKSLPPGLIIAAPRSGAGKTTMTLGLLAALKRRGLAVQPFKCGPDYIDPAFHTAACGLTSYNIDSWAMPWPLAADLLVQQSSGAELVVAEALMGLFDGVAQKGAWGNGASADLAAVTGWPVVLVLDVSGQSQTAAATARGFRDFREGVKIAGVILNRVGSGRHRRLASDALVAAGLRVFGALPRHAEVALPERHLGLVQAGETSGLVEKLEALAVFVEANVDVSQLIEIATAGKVEATSDFRVIPPGQRIALARDAAFSFVYPHVLTGWRSAGAEIVPFSPLADEGPDEDADVAWLPGGYPELHAGRLAGACRFKSALCDFASTRPVHGECGGYMTLGAGLVDAQGRRHEMVGLLDLETSFEKRSLHLGYRRARLLESCVLGEVGNMLSGHEFHYSTILTSDDISPFKIWDADGSEIVRGGSRRGLVTGSFFHLIAAGITG